MIDLFSCGARFILYICIAYMCILVIILGTVLVFVEVRRLLK